MYSKEDRERILADLAASGLTAAAFARIPGNPSRGSLRKWGRRPSAASSTCPDARCAAGPTCRSTRATPRRPGGGPLAAAQGAGAGRRRAPHEAPPALVVLRRGDRRAPCEPAAGARRPPRLLGARAVEDGGHRRHRVQGARRQGVPLAGDRLLRRGAGGVVGVPPPGLGAGGLLPGIVPRQAPRGAGAPRRALRRRVDVQVRLLEADMRGERRRALDVPQGCRPDNARAEGFFGTLKEEFYNGRDWSQVGVRRVQEADRRLHRMVRERQAQGVRRGRAQGVRHHSRAAEAPRLYRVGGPRYCRTPNGKICAASPLRRAFGGVAQASLGAARAFCR